MRQIPLKQAEALIKRAIKANTARITLLTKKKDRSILIEKNCSELKLIEQGYITETTIFTDSNKAKHAVQTAFKREFPRSHRVYVSENK